MNNSFKKLYKFKYIKNISTKIYGSITIQVTNHKNYKEKYQDVFPIDSFIRDHTNEELRKRNKEYEQETEENFKNNNVY